MTQEEATEGRIITRAEALAEIRRHGIDTQEFLDEIGDRETYNTTTVMDWMGY